MLLLPTPKIVVVAAWFHVNHEKRNGFGFGFSSCVTVSAPWMGWFPHWMTGGGGAGGGCAGSAAGATFVSSGGGAGGAFGSTCVGGVAGFAGGGGGAGCALAVD